ncbi:hypothetical protein WKV44_10600 [Spirochaetia bacterium 38H-sp]|uniref:Uncharacterized protein n=1 Tax=Rarispira pelagica TaxID=3141764 RepID=A0ABU9UG70_9SPIR
MMEILGYVLYPGQEDYKTRWIKEEDYDEVVCEECHSLLVDDYFNDDVKLQKMKYDFLWVADGANIFVTEKVKQFIIDNGYTGIELRPLRTMEGVYNLKCNNLITIEKELLDYGKKCNKCGEYTSITTGQYSIFYKNKWYYTYVKEKVKDGFFITDLKFGEHTYKSPELIIGTETYKKMKKAHLKGFIAAPLVKE